MYISSRILEDGNPITSLGYCWHYITWNLFIWIRIFVLTRVFPLFMLGSAWSLGYSTLLEAEDFWRLSYLRFCVVIFHSVGHVYYWLCPYSVLLCISVFRLVLLCNFMNYIVILFHCVSVARFWYLSVFVILFYVSHMHINPINNLCFVLLKLTISVDFNGTKRGSS